MKERKEVSAQDKWNVEALYSGFEAWEKEFNETKEAIKTLTPKFKGHLKEGTSIFKAALELYLNLERKLDKLYTYAHLRHDEDITEDQAKSANDRISALFFDFRAEVSWFEPEILALDDATIQNYLKSPELGSFRFYIEKIVRVKPHILSADKEALIAIAGKALQTPPKAFSALNNADIKFKQVKDSSGQSHDLTHGLYQLYLRSPDRILRENAFKSMHGEFFNLENTMAELLNGGVQSHIFNAKARHFPNALNAALFQNNIPVAVYHSLIQNVHQGLSSLHRYINLRKKILKVSQLHLYDMYVPLVPSVDIKMDYEIAEKVVIESVAPLGRDYQNILQSGFLKEKWVDRYENKNKRSGAYSSGCYDSFPYILMNYRGLLRDAFTLAHEAGHSMHSYWSRKAQAYHDSHYSIFLAEVASTFNEELLMHDILKKVTKKEERIYLINEKLEDIRATFFRQTMFAEFELWLHQTAEAAIPLTPSLIKSKYLELNALYFGKEAFIDQEIAIEWARIPHFYYNFYVYQYATGISAALYLSEKVLSGDTQACDAYLTFLKSGGSGYPIDLLKQAGVDMTTAAPVQSTLRKFDHLVSELESLLSVPTH